jgi:hypothetical protein
VHSFLSFSNPTRCTFTDCERLQGGPSNWKFTEPLHNLSRTSPFTDCTYLGLSLLAFSPHHSFDDNTRHKMPPKRGTKRVTSTTTAPVTSQLRSRRKSHAQLGRREPSPSLATNITNTKKLVTPSRWLRRQNNLRDSAKRRHCAVHQHPTPGMQAMSLAKAVIPRGVLSQINHSASE